MSTTVIPTMGINGFISDIDELLNKIYFYYLTSDYTQSVTFFGKIKSLSYALKRADYKPEKSTEIVQEDLLHILHRYFPNLNPDSVVTTYKESLSGANKVIYIIGIDIELVDGNGKKHQLSKSIELDPENKIHFNDSLDYLLYFANNKN